MSKHSYSTTVIVATDWVLIETALCETKYASVFEKLYANENKPMPAHLVLPAEIVNQGHEHVNNVFRKMEVPFRLTRIGPYDKEESRSNRLLAFVSW